MKKNNGRKVALLTALVLIVTLVSTSLLGGTLAKYVTSKAVDETARVAKWGINFTAPTGLFSKTYDPDDVSYTQSDYTVESTTEVVAPGTSGKLGTITISGTPEVAARVTFVVDTTNSKLSSTWDYDLGGGSYYYPVLWTLKVGGTTEVDKGTFAALLSALALVEFDDFKPGEAIGALDVEISWEWPFIGNDVGDTYYGDKAVTDELTITLKFDIVVTQID